MIISTNTNPANASKYARHRSLKSGGVNKLQAVVQALRATQGMTCHEYNSRDAKQEFQRAWGVFLGATREMGTVVRHWEPKSASPVGIRNQLPLALRADFAMIWADFNIIADRRLSQGGDGYTGNQMIFVAWSRTSLDLIFSKWGYGESTRKGHHFFHWQARTQGVQGAVNVDDYLAAA
jgi:hypothetical protein